MSFLLSVSYINLPVNPTDPNDPSNAASAAPRDGGKDKDVREDEETLVRKRESTFKATSEIQEDNGLADQKKGPEATEELTNVYMSIPVFHYFWYNRTSCSPLPNY